MKRVLSRLGGRLPLAALLACAGWAQQPAAPAVQPVETQPAPEETGAPATQPLVFVEQPDTPTSAPALVNFRRTPAEMYRYFLAAVSEDRFADARKCLNLSLIDEEVLSLRGNDYVIQLAAILLRLEAEGQFDPASLPEDPTAPSQTIGSDPLLLVLERGEITEGETTMKVWQFAASTVADVPTLYASLEEMVSQMSLRDTGPPATVNIEADRENPLRSPYHLVQRFFVSVGSANTDPSAYEDAMECMDFTLVDTEDVQVKTQYVDNLYAILEQQRSERWIDRESLPQQGDTDFNTITIGRDPYQIIIVRQIDMRWRFAARTVARVPEMIQRLQNALQQRAPGEAADMPVAPPEIRLDTSSPQATLNLYLTAIGKGDIDRAVHCLDRSGWEPASDDSIARTLAGKLWMILNRHKVIVLQEVPGLVQPESLKRPYSLLNQPAGRVELAEQRGGPRNGEWLFSAATVRNIEELYRAYEREPILPELRNSRLTFWSLPALYVREYVVPPQFKQPFGRLQVWQWFGLLIVFAGGLLVRTVVRIVLPPVTRRAIQTETTAVLPATVRGALAPTATLAMVALWWAGMHMLDMPAIVMIWAWRVLRVALVLAAIVAVYRLIDLGMAYASARAAQRAVRLDAVLVPLLQKTTKVLVIAVGGVLLAKTVGFEVTPLLAGLGVGGLAFGLAAQDTLKNFFGSVNVVLDRPFQVGDAVKIGDIEGTVESVGLRSSRIRTGYDSQVTVPNSELMNARIDNLGRRQYRRTLATLSLAYETSPEKLEAFCEGVRTLVRQHPYTRKDFYQCWVSGLGASSIDVLLCCFHDTEDWGTELRERHRLFLDIIRLAERLGVEFAYPTQSVHVHPVTDTSTKPLPSGNGPVDVEQAVRIGAREAAAIVREAFGEHVQKPPAVKY